jgi:hypothetical protein
MIGMSPLDFSPRSLLEALGGGTVGSHFGHVIYSFSQASDTRAHRFAIVKSGLDGNTTGDGLPTAS